VHRLAARATKINHARLDALRAPETACPEKGKAHKRCELAVEEPDSEAHPAQSTIVWWAK